MLYHWLNDNIITRMSSAAWLTYHCRLSVHIFPWYLSGDFDFIVFLTNKCIPEHWNRFFGMSYTIKPNGCLSLEIFFTFLHFPHLSKKIRIKFQQRPRNVWLGSQKPRWAMSPLHKRFRNEIFKFCLAILMDSSL